MTRDGSSGGDGGRSDGGGGGRAGQGAEGGGGTDGGGASTVGRGCQGAAVAVRRFKAPRKAAERKEVARLRSPPGCRGGGTSAGAERSGAGGPAGGAERSGTGGASVGAHRSGVPNTLVGSAGEAPHGGRNKREHAGPPGSGKAMSTLGPITSSTKELSCARRSPHNRLNRAPTTTTTSCLLRSVLLLQLVVNRLRFLRRLDHGLGHRLTVIRKPRKLMSLGSGQ